MKFLYTVAYFAGGLLIAIAILGGNVMYPMINSLSEVFIERAGFKKDYVTAVDNRIDDLLYKSKQIELQIERIKNFFSSENIDESKYKKEQNNMLKRAVYDPFVLAMNYVIRTMVAFAGFLMLFAGAVVHLVDSSRTLRRRVRRLEEKVAALSAK